MCEGDNVGKRRDVRVVPDADVFRRDAAFGNDAGSFDYCEARTSREYAADYERKARKRV